MPTQHVATTTVVSGVRQVPVMTKDQLVPGVLLAGPDFSHMWRIEEIDGGQVVVMSKWPPQAQELGHVHGFTLHGNAQCPCGLRREPISGLLPATGSEDLARAYILEPLGDLCEVDKEAVYVSAGRVVLATTAEGLWNGQNVPIIPMLHEVWSVPLALRQALRT